MSSKLDGGCACGAVRYSIAGQPKYMGNCHCRDCQHATGSAYFPAVLVSIKEFTQHSGNVTWYESKADSGQTMQRAFCPQCGSPLFLRNPAREGGMVLYASSLDDPSVYEPSRDIYTDSAQPWVPIEDGMLNYTHQPKSQDELNARWKAEVITG